MIGFQRRQVVGAVGGLLAGLGGCTSVLDDVGLAGDDGGESAVDWPLVGRTPTNRLFVGDGAPASGDPGVAWRYEYDGVDAPELSYSGPVVVDGVVYVAVTGRYQSPDGEYPVFVNEVVGIDAATGDRVSGMTFLEDEDTAWGGVLSPAVADGRLYLGGFGLFAFDLDSGDRHWSNPDPTVMGQLVAVEDDLYGVTLGDGQTGLAGFDASDGTRRWRTDVGRYGIQPPAVGADSVYVPDGPDVVAVDRADGTERWRTNAGVRSYSIRPGREDGTPVTSPVLDGDTLYVAGGLEGIRYRDAGALVALDRETGEFEWSFQPEPSASDRYSFVGGTPALHDGTLFVTGAFIVDGERNPPMETVLYAVDAVDGSLEWETSTPGVAGYVVGSGDSVVVVSEAGVTTHAVSDGTVRGRLPSDGGPPAVTTANAVSGGRVFTEEGNGVTAYEFG